MAAGEADATGVGSRDGRGRPYHGNVVRILAVADEVNDALYTAETLKRAAADVAVSCGDLPFDYLEYLVTILNVPLLYVPGNHDPDLGARSELEGLGLPPLQVAAEWTDRPSPGPQGGTNVDGRVEVARGLRVGGLGGSVRYREGPNQYTQAQMGRRARLLALRARLRGGLDLLVTHAPPLGVGDEEDPAHTGFSAFHWLANRLRPRLLVHGHIHPYGRKRPDRRIGEMLVVNAVPSRIVEVSP
jgi:Calcineurin-like phosphoesterase